MRHPDSTELQRLVDGELSRRRAHEVSAHVRSCPDCAAKVEGVRAVGDLLRMASNEVVADAPLEGLADRVLARIEEESARSKLAWSERLRVWLGEVVRHRRRAWAPPLALAGAAAAVVIVVFTYGDEVPPMERPPSSTVLSVSFGASIDGTVFAVEDKDGSTTAVIWVDEGKSVATDTGNEVKQSFQWWGEEPGAKGAKRT